MCQGKSLAPAVVLFGRLSPGTLRYKVSVGFLGSFQLLTLFRTPSHLEVSCGLPALEVPLLSLRSPGSFLPSLAPKLEQELFRQPSLEGAGNVTFGAGQGRAGLVGRCSPATPGVHWGPSRSFFGNSRGMAPRGLL